MEKLSRKITLLEGKGYKGYKDLKGLYHFEKYELSIDHVQADPFAPPSRIRIRVPLSTAKFPANTFATRSREIALRDFLARIMKQSIGKHAGGRRGTGKSGSISIAPTGQEILERSSVLLSGEFIEARIAVGLPAYGRKIAAGQAKEIFFVKLPAIAADTLFFQSIGETALMRHIRTAEDADYARNCLRKSGMVAFIADGAVLPRKSGVDQAPLKNGTVIPFSSPGTMRTEMNLPNAGKITGMGIREGITLITGGGFHGKSTLLNAIQMGVYNHVPGDGRELAITVCDGLKIRAEDGRRVEKVDISPFIDNLPLGRETKNFSTDNASGSTSQAANIMEAMESGAGLLLLDEDTSATNFMIRDHRMQRLVPKDKEPITPFIDRIKSMHRNYGISTILVMGGSGDYLDVADYVIHMQDYRPLDITEKAKEIAIKYRSYRMPENAGTFGKPRQRIPLSDSFDPSRGRRDVKITTKGLHVILFGKHVIDLSALEQLSDTGQTKAIADAVQYARRFMDGKNTLMDIIDMVMDDIEKKGIDALGPFLSGEYAVFRKLELSSAINRLRTLQVNQDGDTR